MQYDQVKSVGCSNWPMYSFLCWATSGESRRFSPRRPQQVLQKCIHTAKIFPTFSLPPMVCSQRKGKERYLTKQRVKMGSVRRSRITNFSMNSTKLCSSAPSILCARFRQQCLSWQLQLSMPLRPTCHQIASNSAISAGQITIVRSLVLSTAARVTATMCANLRDSTSCGKSHWAEKFTFPARQLLRWSWKSSRRRGRGVRSAIIRRSSQAGQLPKQMRLTPCDSIPVRSGAGSYCWVMSFSCCMEQQLSRKVRLRARPRFTRGIWTACRQMSSSVLGCGFRQNLHFLAQSLFYRNLAHSCRQDRSVLMKQGRSGETIVTMFLTPISSTRRERKRLCSSSFSTPASRICRLGCSSFAFDLLP